MDIKQYIASIGSGQIVPNSPYHKGGELDIDGEIGDPVTPFKSGRVVETGTTGPYGNHIVIQSEDGKKYLYAHLDSLLVKKNDQISEGMLIGKIGNSGKTIAMGGGDGSHLHVEEIKGNIMGKKSYKEFAKAVKAKYPEYRDADDLKLATAMLQKYPEYASQVDLGGEKSSPLDPITPVITAPEGITKGTETINQIEDGSKNVQELGETMSDKIGKIAGVFDSNIKNPSVGLRTAAYLPGELVHQAKEASLDVIEPELKGAATGIRSLQATPQLIRGTGGLLTDLIKTKPSVLLDAIKNPNKYTSPRANSGFKKADETMAKPILGQKTLSGSSNAENIKTAAIAGLQALGYHNPSAVGGLISKTTKSGAGLVGKLIRGAIKTPLEGLKYTLPATALSATTWALNKLFKK